MDESDVEDEADKDFVENNSEEGLEKNFNSFLPAFQLGNQPFEETLLHVDEDINPEPTHLSFYDEHESEAIISKEAMQRHVDTKRSVKTGSKFSQK